MKLPFRSNERTLHNGNLKIRIIRQSRMGVLEKLFEDATESAALSDPRTRSFRKLTFMLQDQQKHGKTLAEFLENPEGLSQYGFVSAEEVDSKEAVIHFLVDSMVFAIVKQHEPALTTKESGFMNPAAVESETFACVSRNLSSLFTGVFNHEMTHAMHFLRGKYAERAKKALTKMALIEQRIQKNMLNIAYVSNYAALLGSFREMIEILLLKIYAEGLAIYYQTAMKNPGFQEAPNAFDYLYVKAFGVAEAFFKWVKNDITRLGPGVLKNPALQSHFMSVVTNQIKLSEPVCRPIGLHMAFTIETTFHLEERLLDLTLGEFIRLYEKACELRKVRPVISLSSGKGLFDYKETLRILYRAEHPS